MSKFVIEEQSVDSLKENYNKVIFQKQMLVAQSEKKKMETARENVSCELGLNVIEYTNSSINDVLRDVVDF